MPENRFRDRLAGGETLFGLWLGLANPYSAEICAGAGFDWLLIDGEHAPNDLRSIAGQLQAIAGHPVSAVARPPVGEAWMIKQYLDLGITTLLVPMVDTSEQAQAMVAATRYPPRGVRGVGAALARASGFGRDRGYLAQADASVCLILQIESRSGLENLAAIAATEGVDGIFFGPADLSASLGLLGQPGHPDVVAAVAGAIARVRDLGKAAGVLTADPDLARRYVAAGANFVAVGTDVTVLAQGTSALRAGFRVGGDRPAAY